jgi:succinate dehydrogenase/fumarate reductase-like Fe-S protein
LSGDGKITVDLKVKRYNPDRDKRPYWQEFRVEAEPTDRVLDALHTAKWEIGRASCRDRVYVIV